MMHWAAAVADRSGIDIDWEYPQSEFQRWPWGDQ